MTNLSSKYKLMSGDELWSFLKENKPFREAYIVSPYFSDNGLSKLFSVIEPEKRKSNIQFILRNDLLGIATGAINIEALEHLIGSNNHLKYNSSVDVRWNPNLHLKMYLFKPGNICIIGSSNMTQYGFSNENLELNVVWKNSSVMFEYGLEIFNKIWSDNSTKVISEDDIRHVKQNLSISGLKKIKNSIDVLKAASRKICEFSITGKEHQSYQVLKKIGKYVSQGRKWGSLVKFTKKIGKGKSDIQFEAKLLFLIINGFTRQNEDSKIVLTDFGKKIISDPYCCFTWLSEIDPLIIKIMKTLSKNKSRTYTDLMTDLDLKSKDRLFSPIHWLASLKMLSYVDKKERQWKLTKKGNLFYSSVMSSDLTEKCED